jgi:dTDP-4-amino-4,6-dideoxygalactose transaminase
MRDNGKTHDHTMAGTNSKMSEVDCAGMLVKLRHFDSWQQRRQEIAEYYTEQLQDHVLVPDHVPEVTHSWSKYVIHHHDRSIIQTGLNQAGIETKIHYARPLHLESVAFMTQLVTKHYQLDGADNFCRTSLSLPIYPELSDSEVETVVDTIKQYI